VAKSQHQNRALAIEILRTRLLERAQAEHDAKIGAARRKQIGSGDRSERIRTYNFPQNRVTDHRLEGEKNFPLQRIIDGDMDELLDRLAQEMAAFAGEGGRGG
jgi:peptide chain release factor 1